MYLRIRNLENLSQEQFIAAFRAIPPDVTSLDLSSNFLHQKTGTELATAFREIPLSATSLNLGWNYLHQKTVEELAAILAAIPPTVSSLDLSCNDLSLKTSEELATAFRAIPLGMTSLDLSSNDLCQKTGEELAAAFRAIPTGVTSLNLSSNDLRLKTGEELATAFRAIPPTVTSLDLSYNILGFKTGEELATAFRAIPLGMTSLDLSHNVLGLKTGEELAASFRAIPPGVTSLNLRGNYLSSKTGEELAAAFRAIPLTVTSLNLDKNHLVMQSSEDLVNIFSSIPPSVENVVLGYDFPKLEIEAFHIENQVNRKLNQPISLSMLNFSDIKSLFGINEDNLSKIIDRLKKQDTGDSLLASALLLLGDIENQVNEGRDAISEKEYQTNRILSAIDFLDKSVKATPKYHNVIAHILWDLKETRAYDDPRVNARLMPYNVRPLPEVVSRYGTFFKADSKVETTIPRPLSKPSSPYRARGILANDLPEAGADKYKATDDGATPLFIAAQNGHLDIVKSLLAFNADIKLTRQEKTPLFQAALSGQTEVVNLLAKHPETTCKMLMEAKKNEVVSSDIQSIIQQHINHRIEFYNRSTCPAITIRTIDSLDEEMLARLDEIHAEKEQPNWRVSCNDLKTRVKQGSLNIYNKLA